jgi:hypothetical protein
VTASDNRSENWQCVRCGRTEGLKPYDYHAYRVATSHGPVPRSWKEIAKVFQGQTVYHDLIQFSALVCPACIRRLRWRRLGLLLAVVGLLAAAALLCAAGYLHYMDRFRAAGQQVNDLLLSDHSEGMMPGLREGAEPPEQSLAQIERQGRLQRARGDALNAAMALRWATVLAALAAVAVAAWGLWELRRVKLGQSIAVACLRPVLRERGLKHVARGHLVGGHVVEKPEGSGG